MEIISKHNKIASGIIIFLCTILVLYLVASTYFIKHLYFGSKINGTDVSGKTVEQIKSQMAAGLNTYTLVIKERGGMKEQIKAGDINLKYKSDEQFNNFKNRQNPLKWALSIFSPENYKMIAAVTYDKERLMKKVDSLSCLSGNNIIEPKEPSIKYTGSTFKITDEVKGNKVDKNILIKCVSDAISMKDSTIDLDSDNCYINPKYTSKSPKVTKARDMLNKYASSKVTYTIGDNKVILDGSTINKWLIIDDNFNVSLDEGKVEGYIYSLAYTYNTAGITRSFHTTAGNTINVSGGDYGWQINIDKEIQNLCEIIKEGQTVAKKPEYVQTAASYGSNDIGNTYVEIDLTKQHLWFYKNGSLVIDGDVVTGCVSENHATPAGVYRLKAKERNATLKGQGYASPVSYWMPFNQGIGIHDAPWRSVFGGQIYETDGSHGCINSPFNVAQTIFENIDVGTPVVCY